MFALTQRNATLSDLADLLALQHTAKLDLVVAATKLRAVEGHILIRDVEPILTEDDGGGVIDPNGMYALTAIADETLGDKWKIPVRWMRFMRDNRPDIFDSTVNPLIHGKVAYDDQGQRTVVYPADPRRFLIRSFTSGDPDRPNILRSVLSDGYKIVDNLDMLTAALAGLKQSGLEIGPENFQADLSERNMYLRIACPSVSVEAEALLKDYRSPFADPNVKRAGEAAHRYGGMDGQGNATVSAGVEVRNSETGDGGWSLTPFIHFHVCMNGMTFRQEAFGGVHLGGRKAEGIVTWSEDTMSKELAVVTAKARDAMKTFLSVDWLTGKIRDLEIKAGVPVTDADDHIQHVAKTLKFSDTERRGILDHFIRGGQLTSGGVMQATTSYAQTEVDPDRAADLRDAAVTVLDVSARYAMAR